MFISNIIKRAFISNFTNSQLTMFYSILDPKFRTSFGHDDMVYFFFSESELSYSNNSSYKVICF